MRREECLEFSDAPEAVFHVTSGEDNVTSQLYEGEDQPEHIEHEVEEENVNVRDDGDTSSNSLGGAIAERLTMFGQKLMGKIG